MSNKEVSKIDSPTPKEVKIPILIPNCGCLAELQITGLSQKKTKQHHQTNAGEQCHTHFSYTTQPSSLYIQLETPASVTVTITPNLATFDLNSILNS
ncbi:hypothetical protein VNO77_13554 [Canavalia gladiata]|uniref:Uncharacterized protein n=1 Tax=Canavalia gladiata TaxID=3824 RepID=A0AAN9M1Y0_CANGL